MENTERIITSIIDDNAAGQRIDLWLSRRFTYHSRRQWQDTIRDGKILLNGKKTRCSRVLQSGETVSFIPDREEPHVDMTYKIEYEDDYFFVINKGGNLPCHPAGPFFKHTLWYDMCQKHGKVYIANRLDRETSGLMLIGKTPEVATKLSDLFTSDSIQKKYYSLVFNRLDSPLHAKGYLINDEHSEVRKKRRFVYEQDYRNEDGESAETFISPVTPGDKYSLVEAVPKTGRLHQIRATLYSLGYPLLGDKLYGPDDTIYLRFAQGAMTDCDRNVLLLPRQALHAWSLEFTHPYTGKDVSFSAPCPDDMTVST